MPAALDLPAPFREENGQILIDLPGARALFTTRRGGVSEAPYDTLNFGILTDDDPAAVRANRDRVAARHGVRFAWRKQVHGTAVHTVTEPNATDETPEDGDGVATATPGVAGLVLGADCLPVIITAPGAVAAVHAGWPGLAKGIVARGVQAVRELVGRDAPLTAAIGPGAGPCCYEVGPELHERFADLGYGTHRHGDNLDLKGIATDQLRAAGVATVHDVGLCTMCTPGRLLYSHRRDRAVTGRQAGIVWRTDEGVADGGVADSGRSLSAQGDRTHGDRPDADDG